MRIQVGGEYAADIGQHEQRQSMRVVCVCGGLEQLQGFIAREPIRLSTTEVLEAVSQLRRFARSRALS